MLKPYFIFLFFTCIAFGKAQNNSQSHIDLLNGAERGDLEVVKKSLMDGADINIQTYEGVSPLMYAVLKDQTQMVTYLLGVGADPNLLPDDGSSPLIQSVFNGNLEIGRQLMYHGASHDHKDDKEASAMGYAIVLDKIQFLDMLLQFNPNTNDVVGDRTSALMLAVLKNNYGATEILLKQGVATDSKDVQGATALMMAAQMGYENLVKLLLDYGADVHAKNSSGYDAIAYAIRKNQFNIVKILLGRKEMPTDAVSQISYQRALKNSTSDSTKKYLISKGFKNKFYGKIDGTFFGAAYLLGVDDEQVELSIGFRELYTQLEVYAVYNRRLNKSIVWTSDADALYQYSENRQSVGVHLKRSLSIAQIGSHFNLSLVPVAGYWHSFYQYEGLSDSFEQEQMFQLGGDIRFSWQFSAIEIGAHWIDYKQYLKDRVYFRIGYKQLIYLKNKPMKLKRDRWRNIY